MSQNECCSNPDNLGEVQDRRVSMKPLANGEVEVEQGYRRCKVCLSRHFFMRALPGIVGSRGATLGE